MSTETSVQIISAYVVRGAPRGAKGASLAHLRELEPLDFGRAVFPSLREAINAVRATLQPGRKPPLRVTLVPLRPDGTPMDLFWEWAEG